MESLLITVLWFVLYIIARYRCGSKERYKKLKKDYYKNNSFLDSIGFHFKAAFGRNTETREKIK